MNCNLEFCFPRDDPLDDFQGPLDFSGHSSWLVCKAALRTCRHALIPSTMRAKTLLKKTTQ